MNRFYALRHAPVEFYFRQSANDFVVDEIPLYPFSSEGEHLVLHIRKKNLTTWEMVDVLSRHLGVKAREIGYAGLKDKNALTKQYISVHKKYEEKIDGFSRDGIKILSKTYHKNKIKMGHLKGNRFFIRLKRVTPMAAKKIDEALDQIRKNGMPNFFGYQRFGNDGDNYKLGMEIVQGKRREKKVKLKKLLVNSYQSHLFNLWLSRRIEINILLESFDKKELSGLLNMDEETITALQKQKHPFKLMQGDVMMHYPYGRAFILDGEEDIERFSNRDIVPGGLLCGKRVMRSEADAYKVEKEYDEEIGVDGARRFAWIFPEDIEGEYKEDEAWFELHFTLPKGSYATVLLEQIAKRPINEEKDG
jgi:tRNA pseudouridine13 synthase